MSYVFAIFPTVKFKTYLRKKNFFGDFFKITFIFKCHLESWQRTPINIISPSMFHLNRVENGKGDISSEAHLQNSKTSRVQLFFVQIFEFYRVTQSLFHTKTKKQIIQVLGSFQTLTRKQTEGNWIQNCPRTFNYNHC